MTIEQKLERIFLITTLSEIIAACDVALTLGVSGEIAKSIRHSRDFAIGARKGVYDKT